MEFFATVSLYAITGYFIYNIDGIIFGGATHKVYRVPSTTEYQRYNNFLLELYFDIFD